MDLRVISGSTGSLHQDPSHDQGEARLEIRFDEVEMGVIRDYNAISAGRAISAQDLGLMVKSAVINELAFRRFSLGAEPDHELMSWEDEGGMVAPL